MKALSSIEKAWNVLTQKMETVLIRKGPEVIKISIDDLKKNELWKLSKNAAEYAVFSDLVYHDISDTASVPRHLYAGPILDEILSDWQFVPENSSSLYLPRQNSGKKLIPGLKYHFWYSRAGNEFVIVFRGTAIKWDWWANFRWVTRWIPGIDDHYDVVREGISPLVGQIRESYGSSVKISVAGHSLGGGLAQLAAYQAERIENVYVFNSTPVTAFYEVDKTVREKNSKDLKIVRVFEHGEVLAYLRLPLRLFYWLSKESPEIHEMRFNLLTRKNLISEHSMNEFARFLYENLNPEPIEIKPPQPELLQ